MINSVNSSRNTVIKPLEMNVVKKSSDEKKETDEGVTLEIGSSKAEKPNTYTKSVKPDAKTIEQLQKQVDDAMAPLRLLVESLFKEQGLTYHKANGNALKGKDVQITPEIRSEAQSLIDDGGAFSAENTATRLVDFAIAISGGDKSKINLLRSSIQKGFDAAKGMLGGTLPDISKQTYDLTMQKLDEWAKS